MSRLAALLRGGQKHRILLQRLEKLSREAGFIYWSIAPPQYRYTLRNKGDFSSFQLIFYEIKRRPKNLLLRNDWLTLAKLRLFVTNHLCHERYATRFSDATRISIALSSGP